MISPLEFGGWWVWKNTVKQGIFEGSPPNLGVNFTPQIGGVGVFRAPQQQKRNSKKTTENPDYPQKKTLSIPKVNAKYSPKVNAKYF